MTAPKWATALLQRVAPRGRAEDVVGDLEEAHRNRVRRRGPIVGSLLTGLEAVDVAAALVLERYRRGGRSSRLLAVRARRRRTIWVSWLDFKLGFRMLVKYPGLTVIGGLAIAFAIWVGAGTFEFVTQAVRPTLPLDEGDRIVGIRNWDVAASRVEAGALHDFITWREELQSVEDLGAFGTLERNLKAGHGSGAPVELAEISASAFRVARVLPLLGRSLTEADEETRAPPVVVVGHDIWQTRFGGDPDIVGRAVRLGGAQATVVGVMPEGFAFPVSHGLWIPLRLNVLDYERGDGPAITVFGRLARGFSLDEAQAELATIGRRAAADFPATHEHLRPEVMPFARSIVSLSGRDTVGLVSINLFLVMLLVLVCGNVALLMFARAATRESEMLVRKALGASRGRIVTQLFAEALVLGGVATVVGLAAAGFGLRWGFGVIEAEFLGGGRLPFWFRDRLAPTTVVYAIALTLLGAAVAGVVPALKVTRGLHASLQQAVARGEGLRFGGLWTAVIVTQVAVTVTFPAFAFFLRRDVMQIRSVDVGFPAEEYLSVQLEMDRELQPGSLADTSEAEFLARFRATVEELKDRLAADPAVAGVTVADRLPRMYHPHRLIVVDAGGAAPLDPQWPGYRVSSATIDADYFEILGTPILSGRGFYSGEVGSDGGVVVINQSFVDRVLGGRNPIGRRMRYLYLEEWGERGSPNGESGPWYEIVGVVRDLGMAVEPDPKVAGLYHPVPPVGVYPIHMAVHVRGDVHAYASRLRRVADAVDPALRLDRIVPLDQVDRATLKFYGFWYWLLVSVSSIALLLCLAGIYSVMAFTVSQRTREIGIRVALGAGRRRIALAVFRRPLAQVGLGIVAGGVLTAALAYGVLRGALWPNGAALVVAYAALMMGVCMLACIVPTRRALGVEPTEALKADG